MAKQAASSEANEMTQQERKTAFEEGLTELQKKYGFVATPTIVVERVNDSYVVTKAVLQLADVKPS